ncbi:MAG: tRNA pseudouridine(55) synthase TruB [Candidatus Moranbacteria bacterium]|nr:tRNA pseudouridine(55) synthase TruB [Candidatus Moranbacteria bacterium]
MFGIFAVYKPAGPTSNDVVMRLKKAFGEKKVGHAGTLDPLAEGVLVVGVGREATKKLGEVSKLGKEYEAVIKLGEESETDDEQGEKTKIEVEKIPEEHEIKEVLKSFEGNIKQKPPLYSAVKVNGKEAYKRVRKGEEFQLKPREALVEKIESTGYDWPELKIRTVTGSGVYIRSLARDIGRALKTGGYLKKLKRIRVGEFGEEECYSLDELLNC